MESPNRYAPRIYFFHSLLVGPLDAWPARFAHAASLGFDHALIGSLFEPGQAGHGQVVGNHARLHPVFETQQAAADAIRTLADAASQNGLTLLVDLVIDRMAADGALYAEHADWFHPFESDEARLDPRHVHREDNVAYANFNDAGSRAALADWWTRQLLALADAGVGGFRFDSPHRVPGAVWRQLGDAVRLKHPNVRFLAATPGLSRSDLPDLEGAGFDSVFSSVRWWDFRSSWMVEEHAALARIAGPVAFPEAPYGTRLAAEFSDAHDAAIVERAYRRAMLTAASIGTGWMMPMGFEYGVTEPMSQTRGDASQYALACQAKKFDLAEPIARLNEIVRNTSSLQANGELRPLSGPGAPAAVLLRADHADLRDAGEAILIAINPELGAPVRVDPARFLAGVPGNFTRFVPLDAPGHVTPATLTPFTLAPGAARLFRAVTEKPICLAPPIDKPNSKRSGHKAVLEALNAPRVAIESVTPSVDHGRFAAKRSVGERAEISAAIFAEGHDKIAAAVIWRAADETAWHEVLMTPAQPAGLDIWKARIPLERLGRHEFTVIAWRDDFASLVEHIEKKLKAGQTVELELDEAAHLFALVLAEVETAEGAVTEPLERIVTQFTKADVEAKLALILAPATAKAMTAARHRPFLSRDPVVYKIDADRAAARFASWYEIFPRSMSDDESRHGTFADVTKKLPRIRDMGFDVLYFPPIHPIGLANRKGRNNTLNAQPGDVGSPYAIGAAEGGHTAVHPQLGTLDDFKQMLAAAHAHGLEIALDFAIQCSPDHPWLKEHPTWFAWRPDGTLRYAENPPKKYQDIVNPDFYAHDAKPALWLALRDVILFWIEAGVHIFRVDNPHTKPLPFWEWMIDDVRARYPDTIFLAEAFTRPRMMNRLGKIGFSQSYTYFTWRESKRDFIEYLSELTQTDARDSYRPNFFVNTPDINPRHLQSQGRTGFLIRAALASTLAGLWGVYSGFELCEAAALPNSEEYLDSEKYQLRAWDWHRPGNIVGEISALNRIRRANPALQTHLGLTFLPAHNDHVLFFEKATEARDNVIVVAINLDPFNEQGADIELSWETFRRWNLHDHAALEVTDQMTGARFEWHGRWQHVQLGSGQPFSIWRIAPLGGLPADRPDEADSDYHADAGNPIPTEGAT
ncbi:maltotransferase domain-containing protein [Paraburkholderia terricola]|uniref:Alpha-1,4-glucan:maltose-1-phosphate maltosyltransferase n=1 Tax=Paraburkholderia terricola TaxID=169427 RepID=A0A1M6N7N0_9BURK|nr:MULTISPECIES: maltotransferase domain-containing protein [Paraburkholderia]SDO24752.1 starch synthase (maltosyl-transferring) [Paraburkholderia sediminicola]SHJ91703.1 starch synthase (maltosyl-transferring) [Paraburkholderia terricola]